MTTALLLRQLATLLDAGLPVARALQELDDPLGRLPLKEKDALLRRITFSADLGLPLAQTLSDMAERIDQRAEVERELESAFAAPRATARLMLWLPLLSLAVAQLAGLGPFQTLARNGLAQASVGAGTLLLAAGWFAMRHMIAKRQPNRADEGELLDLFADTLLSGLSTNDCFELAAAHLDEVRASVSLGSREGAASTEAADRDRLRQFGEARRLMDFAFANGVRLRSLLLATASAQRAQSRAAQREAIERLSVQLMIPLGLVVLPAFVLIGVLPVAIGMLTRG